MNFLLLTTTFLAANLDFFLILLFLLQKIPLAKVIWGYWLGLLIIISACSLVGSALSAILPEWILGILGVIPIWMSFKDDDDDAPGQVKPSAGALTVTITYLSVCAGCNLAIFLPVLTQQTHSMTTFAWLIAYISVLTIIICCLINLLGKIPVVKIFLGKYGDTLTKICYLGIGVYVFFDSGLIHHLLSWLI